MSLKVEKGTSPQKDRKQRQEKLIEFDHGVGDSLEGNIRNIYASPLEGQNEWKEYLCLVIFHVNRSGDIKIH